MSSLCEGKAVSVKAQQQLFLPSELFPLPPCVSQSLNHPLSSYTWMMTYAFIHG